MQHHDVEQGEDAVGVRREPGVRQAGRLHARLKPPDARTGDEVDMIWNLVSLQMQAPAQSARIGRLHEAADIDGGEVRRLADDRAPAIGFHEHDGAVQPSLAALPRDDEVDASRGQFGGRPVAVLIYANGGYQ